MGGIADIADKFARNEILSSNELRQIVGYKPSKEPKADQLINANMPTSDTGVGGNKTDSKNEDFEKIKQEQIELEKEKENGK